MQFLLLVALILMVAGMRGRRWLVVAGAVLTLPITWYMRASPWPPFHVTAYVSLVLAATVVLAATARIRWLAWIGIALLVALQAAFFVGAMTGAFMPYF